MLFVHFNLLMRNISIIVTKLVTYIQQLRRHFLTLSARGNDRNLSIVRLYIFIHNEVNMHGQSPYCQTAHSLIVRTSGVAKRGRACPQNVGCAPVWSVSDLSMKKLGTNIPSTHKSTCTRGSTVTLPVNHVP